jgi:hypothetical protein
MEEEKKNKTTSRVLVHSKARAGSANEETKAHRSRAWCECGGTRQATALVVRNLFRGLGLW